MHNLVRELVENQVRPLFEARAAIKFVMAFADAVRAASQPASDFARAAAEARSSVAAVLGSVPTPPDFAGLIREAQRRLAEDS